ncbi:MAG: hypothetical protein DRO99_04085 [Candidatus Aenigmatarchaeota archaeon]|nr:MAG: hypothetical protein DRO99_04085 [Candidatus Aenigmarchaeota archaeon]
MNVYQVFKIVLGLVMSFFILFFLVNYAGIYSEIQEDTQRMMIISNFRKAVQDVYLTGNSVTFDDFSRLDFNIVYNGLVDPPVIRSGTGQTIIRTPMVFVPGEEVMIQREDLNFGWWKFGFVEALPEMTVLFNPMDTGVESRNIMKSIVGLFPDTTGRTPRIQFGFCDGNTIKKPCDSGNSFCESYSFMSRIDSYTTPASKCTANLGTGYRLVTLHASCPSGMVQKGVCIVPRLPGAGYGYAYLNGSTEFRLYKNPLDLFALTVGDGSNIYGPVADNLYHNVNNAFTKELLLMSEIVSQRSKLVSSKLPISDEKGECGTYYSALWAALDMMPSITSADGYYNDPAKVSELVTELNNAYSAYQDLVNLGCEYSVI